MSWAKVHSRIHYTFGVFLLVCLPQIVQAQVKSTIPISDIEIVRWDNEIEVIGMKFPKNTRSIGIKQISTNTILKSWDLGSNQSDFDQKWEYLNKQKANSSSITYQDKGYLNGGVELTFTPKANPTANPTDKFIPILPRMIGASAKPRARPAAVSRPPKLLPMPAASLLWKNESKVEFKWSTVQKIAKEKNCNHIIDRLRTTNKRLETDGTQLENYLKKSNSIFKDYPRSTYAIQMIRRIRSTAYNDPDHGLKAIIPDDEPNSDLKQLLGVTEYQLESMDTQIQDLKRKNTENLAKKRLNKQDDREITVSVLWGQMHAYRVYTTHALADVTKACKSPNAKAAVAINQALEETTYVEDSR